MRSHGSGPNVIGLVSLGEEKEIVGLCMHRGKGNVRTQKESSRKPG